MKHHKVRQKHLERTGNATARSAFAEVISREAMLVFDEAVTRLTRRERRAIVMRVVDSLSFARIGRRMGMTEVSARVLVFRARERLQRSLWYLRAT